jgi:hypothetical protein
MDSFLHAKLDSDEDDDDDYVPQQNEASDDSAAAAGDKKSKNALLDEEELTGVAGLKAQKRKKEIDDLWASMQAEDDYYKKHKSNAPPVFNKALKTEADQRVPSVAAKTPIVKPEETKPVSAPLNEEAKDTTFNAALKAIRLMK